MSSMTCASIKSSCRLTNAIIRFGGHDCGRYIIRVFLMGLSSNRSSPPCRRRIIWRHSNGYFHRTASPRDKRDIYRFFLGSFQELAGNTAGALATFNSLQKSWGTKYGGGRLVDKTTEAIKRLSKSNHPERIRN